MTDEPKNLELWLSLLNEAWQLAYGERLAELNGRHPKRFDDRGLHPYSEVWGRIGLLTGGEIGEWMTAALIAGDDLPELAKLCGEDVPRLSPTTLRNAARRAADEEFRRRIKDGEA